MPRNTPPFDQMAIRRAQSLADRGMLPPVPIIGQTEVLDLFGQPLKAGDKVDVRDFDSAKIPRLLFTVVEIVPSNDPRPEMRGVLVLKMSEVLNFNVLVRPGQPTGNLLLAFRPPVEEKEETPEPPAPPADIQDPTHGAPPPGEPIDEVMADLFKPTDPKP